MSNSWFRMYNEVVDDPKVQKLTPALFRSWVNLLCLASANNGVLPPIGDISYKLRISPERADSYVSTLITAGLFERNGDVVMPHNWGGRQFQSDGNSTARMERYREKRRALGLPVLSDYNKFRTKLIDRDGERCIYCDATAALVVDHIFPIDQGGTDHEDNLGLACKRCNSGKSGRTPEQAGYTIRSVTATTAYARYRNNQLVTVTTNVTSPQHQNRTEQNRTEPPKVPRGDECERLPKYTPEFERFWVAYPRHEGKGEAFKAWQKRRFSLKTQDLVVAAVESAKSSPQWIKENGRYIPNASTWLNQARWDDDQKHFNGGDIKVW